MTAENRLTALQLAISVIRVDGNLNAANASEVTGIAGVFYDWLEGPVVMVLTADTSTYQQGAPDGPGTPTVQKGTNVQLTDTQQVTLSVAEVDSKGQPVNNDALTWSVDQPGVVALTPSADSYSCLAVAGTDGTATVTVTDNTVNPPLTATDVITVVSSAATSLVISEGTAEDQPAPAPAA